MSAFFNHLKLAMRRLAKRPGFLMAVVLTLALGIGANTVVFTLIRGLMFQPLPYQMPERLVRLGEGGQWSQEELSFLREHCHTLRHLTGWDYQDLTLIQEGGPRLIKGVNCSATLFELLGVPAMLGRTFVPEEEVRGGSAVVVISHDLWQGLMQGAADVIGRTVTLNDQVRTIIGVMPPGFTFPYTTWDKRVDIWQATSLGGNFMLYARVTDDTPLPQVRQEIGGLTPALKSIGFRLEKYERPINVQTLHDYIIGPARPALLLLTVAVGFVLLIACANVANLFLVRSHVRAREMAIRSALGAGKWQLIADLLMEHVVVVCLGGLLGLLLAVWGVKPLLAALPQNVPMVENMGIDDWVMLYTLGLCGVTVLVCGLFPAKEIWRSHPSHALKQTDRGGGQSPRHRRLREWFVVTEIALALLLVSCAALALRSFGNLLGVEPGFKTRDILTFRVFPSGEAYQDEEQRLAYYSGLLERIEGLPGVTSVGGSHLKTIGRWDWRFEFTCERNEGVRSEGTRVWSYWRVVSPGYFHTLHIPLLQGRAFHGLDERDAPAVCLVNHTLARRLWPGESPLGKRIRRSDQSEDWLTVVGIVGDVRMGRLTQDPEPAIYAPHSQHIWTFSRPVIAVRTVGQSAATIAAIREAAAEVGPTVPLFDFNTMDRILGEQLAAPAIMMGLLAASGAVGLTLGAIGIFGVISYLVTQRMQEFGIRVALGAQQRDLLQMVLLHGSRLVLLGMGLGLLGTFALTRLMTGMLFGVGPMDPMILLAVVTVLGLVGMLACYLPARRAARIDPMAALRYE